ncbi:MAG: sugar ABC transporter permease [Chloroflexi bacterium]|nr:sugar ABC transporter permease [Chloroflexota bacterium]MCY3581942.1 sugar ABC transporter permease [Chloroflexota bacterium]MCY3716419.1 sugar ABC transporter permease [Chloroflexota bacterium]MDE2650921.1 sugar ABC transporter permease [Chloroflexota bacterium]MXV92301.1 sugar ABC transporter permease [Chloroflexota bacterium]
MPRAWLIANQGLLFMVPALVLFVVFVLYPIFYIFAASLYDWDGINQAVYVGVQNYIEMLTDDRAFSVAIRNSVYWTFLTIFPQMILGFVLASILTAGIPFQNVFRVIFFMPAIISPVVLGIIWQRIYAPFGGLLADLAWETGARFLMQPYLSDPKIAIFSTIAVNVWQWTGFSMLMYVAGLNGLPGEVLSAAQVDGAGSLQRTRYIVLPMLRHVHQTLILLGVIGTLQTFALVYMLTKGGPNHATEMLPTYIFQKAFTLQSMGYASAVAVALLVIALSASIFQVRVLGSRFTIGG